MRKKKIAKHSILLTFLIHCLFHPFHLVYLLRPSYSSPYLCLFFSNILILCITIPPPFFSFLSSSLSLSLLSLLYLCLFYSALLYSCFLCTTTPYILHLTFFLRLSFSLLSLFSYITLHCITIHTRSNQQYPFHTHPRTHTHKHKHIPNKAPSTSQASNLPCPSYPLFSAYNNIYCLFPIYTYISMYLPLPPTPHHCLLLFFYPILLLIVVVVLVYKRTPPPPPYPNERERRERETGEREGGGLLH